jgi:hypothetical protein
LNNTSTTGHIEWEFWLPPETNQVFSEDFEDSQWLPIEIQEHLSQQDLTVLGKTIDAGITLLKMSAEKKTVEDTIVMNIVMKTMEGSLAKKTSTIPAMNVVMQTLETIEEPEEASLSKPTYYGGWRLQRATGHWKYGTRKEMRSFLSKSKKFISKDKEIARDVGKLLSENAIAQHMASDVIGRYRKEIALKHYILYGDDSIDTMQDGLTVRMLHHMSHEELKQLRQERVALKLEGRLLRFRR